MKRIFKQQLPAPLVGLVNEIEATAGEISVERVPGLPTEMETTIGWGHIPAEPWNLMVGNGPGLAEDYIPHVTIRYKSDLVAADLIRPTVLQAWHPGPFGLFCHELLHAKRYLVDKIPAVYFISGVPQGNPDPQKQITTVQGMETLLEHLVIERQVRRYVPDYPLDFSWRGLWDQIPPKPWFCEFSIHWQLMHAWLTVQFLNEDDGIKQYAAEAMQRLGWLPEARTAAHLMGQALGIADDPAMAVTGKLGMALVACMVFQIPVTAMGSLCQFRKLEMLPKILGAGLLDRLRLTMPPAPVGGKEIVL